MEISAVVPLVAAFESELKAAGTRERAEKEKRYLKSDLSHLGVTVPKLKAIAVRGSKDLRSSTSYLAQYI